MNQELLDQMLRSPRLPSLPTIALEVIDLVQQRDVNIRQIADTISHDPALAGKILKTVNSSFYGQTQTISTITHALVILGLNAVRTLALGFSLVHNLKEANHGDFDHLAYWKRSLFTAVAARSLARESGIPQQEESFLGGLLQDLGMIVMAQTLGDSYTRLVSEAGTDHMLLCRLETERYQLDHAQVGAALAEQWKLPPILIEPIRYHEKPNDGPEELASLVRCVGLGNRVAEVFMSDQPAGALHHYYQMAQSWFDMPREVSEPLLANVHKNTVEMRRLFDLPTGHLGNADEILARANEALLTISLQQAQKSNELETQNRQLAQQASTDSLTGAANRRTFNEFIAVHFAEVTPEGSPVSLLFIDADKFKNFNDTYGHLIGDRVLIEIAANLKKVAPEGSLVARYGGEEFAVVMPDTMRVNAAQIAESTRKIVEDTPILTDDGQKLKVTVSIGVATHDGTFFERVEQFIKAADQGVYAAKASGRNCVRVFAPKPKAPAVTATPGSTQSAA